MADPVSLLSDDEDDYPVDSFRVNKTFSGAYDTWRQKEEMQKLKDLKSTMSESSSESESEEEPVIEKDFLKALSMLKSEDPRIYSNDVKLFTEDELKVKKPKVKKEKPMFMKDYERELVLNRNGKLSDEDEPNPADFAQKELEDLPMLGNMDSDDEDDDMFTQPKKEKADEEKIEAEYLQFLKGEKEDVKEDAKELSFLHQYWNDPKLDKEEKFLRDYILNEKFLVKDKPEFAEAYSSEMANLSDEERMEQEQEQFEHKYNFRFEEPDTEFIKRYPRTIGESLRREDKRRKVKREEYSERKKKEKEQKQEELKRLKALKRKEIEEKFLKLQEVSGRDEGNFNEEDIESDFDPDKHDKKMKELFNDDYYSVVEEQKPEFEYDEDLDDEKWDLWTREQSAGNGVSSTMDEEDNLTNDEADEEVSTKQLFEQEMVDSTRVGRKRGKKKSLFAKIVSQPKPIYDPEGKSFDQYLDEYYKMDFEDIVGDLPVRFKYRKVVPNDFGLSVDEILAANDKELNRWCSVKKTHQYRHEDEEIYEVQAFKKKAQNEVVKKKIFSSIYSAPDEKDEVENPSADSKEGANKTKRRKKKKKNKNVDVPCENDETQVETVDDPLPEADSSASNKSKKKRKIESLLGEPSNLGSSHFEDQTEPNDDVQFASSNDVTKDGKELSKKSKKRKRKGKAYTIPCEFEVTNFEDNGTLSSVYQKSNNTEEITNTLKNYTEDSPLYNKPSKKQKIDVNIDSKSEKDTNEISDKTLNVSQSNKKSKKKKKRSKNKNNPSGNQDLSSRNYTSLKSKIPEADKKLAMADSRLASYGLNPKKFKNRIIYSK